MQFCDDYIESNNKESESTQKEVQKEVKLPTKNKIRKY